MLSNILLLKICISAKVLHERALKLDFASCINFVALITHFKKEKNRVYEFVLFFFSSRKQLSLFGQSD